MSPVHPYKDKPQPKSEHVTPSFNNGKVGKLGTVKSPAQLTVQTQARQQELAAIAQESGWICEIKIAPELAENIADLTALQNKPVTQVFETKPNRNDSCPCGSGKKYKRCCLGKL